MKSAHVCFADTRDEAVARGVADGLADHLTLPEHPTCIADLLAEAAASEGRGDPVDSALLRVEEARLRRTSRRYREAASRA